MKNLWLPTVVNPWACLWQPLRASGWEPLGASGSPREPPRGGWCDFLNFTQKYYVEENKCKPMDQPLAASGSLWEHLGASGSLWEPLGTSCVSIMFQALKPRGSCHGLSLIKSLHFLSGIIIGILILLGAPKFKGILRCDVGGGVWEEPSLRRCQL